MVDNIAFDSKAEAARYQELKLLFRAGLIRALTLQPKYEIQPKFTAGNGKIIRAIYYIADFAYYEVSRDKWVVEDVKGCKTKDYILKSKMFQYQNADIDFREVY